MTTFLMLERVLVAWSAMLEVEEDAWSVKLLMAVDADEEESEGSIVGMLRVLVLLPRIYGTAM